MTTLDTGLDTERDIRLDGGIAAGIAAAANGPARTALRAATPIDTVLVCHRERLVGAAAAAVLERRGMVRATVTTQSLSRLLSILQRGIEVAVVFDGVDEDVAELFEAMRYRGFATPVLIMTPAADAERAAQVLEWGAAGLLPSSCTPEVMCRAIVDAKLGHAVVPDELRGAVLEALRARRLRRHGARHRLSQLTRMDLHVLRALSDGLTVVEIAARLSLSPHTIRSHVRTLSDKLGVRGQLRVAAAGRDLLSAARHTGWDIAALVSDEEGA